MPIRHRIAPEIFSLLGEGTAYNAVVRAHNPFGDGTAGVIRLRRLSGVAVDIEHMVHHRRIGSYRPVEELASHPKQAFAGSLITE